MWNDVLALASFCVFLFFKAAEMGPAKQCHFTALNVSWICRCSSHLKGPLGLSLHPIGGQQTN